MVKSDEFSLIKSYWTAFVRIEGRIANLNQFVAESNGRYRELCGREYPVYEFEMDFDRSIYYMHYAFYGLLETRLRIEKE